MNKVIQIVVYVFPHTYVPTYLRVSVRTYITYIHTHVRKLSCEHLFTGDAKPKSRQ